MRRYRVFTLEEANRLLDLVGDLTDSTRVRLQELRSAYGEDEVSSSDVEEETRMLIDEWARVILEIGAQPKGVFTVDFRSPDPNVLWCWAPDEAEILHRHFVWESFKDRVSIHSTDVGWPSRN